VTVTSLAGRHALVTGGGTGIGAAIATALAEAGAAVTICGRRRQKLDDVVAANPGMRAVAADVTDEAAMAKLHDDADANRQPIDIVVANAGMVESAPAHRTSLDLWNRTLAINLTGAFLTVKPALARMQVRGWGRVIFIASTAGLKGYPYVAAYVAAKHGLIGLTRALALETAAAGTTVNAVCPGYTETQMLADAVHRIGEATGRSDAETRAALVVNPQGRLIQPFEVAAAVLWLCGDAAAPITGQAISVSGGETW
jgi:NAD(P)-dependent dehydrogenase (short-subunit alcohol dehydrogenase family)